MKKNLANIITLSRIFFVFIVVALLFCTQCNTSYIAALVLTAILTILLYRMYDGIIKIWFIA